MNANYVITDKIAERMIASALIYATSSAPPYIKILKTNIKLIKHKMQSMDADGQALAQWTIDNLQRQINAMGRS